ncbi:MAG: metal-dependent hydrolase [Pirellulaceae bacterium]|nr:metal-dependent hydrolase [Pirellulaceae bacterium]
MTLSTGLGIAYGALGYWQYDLPMGNCVIAGAMCSLAGMLPDLDSDSGVPIRELKLFTSVVIPMLLMERFQRMGMNHSSMVLAGGIAYVIIRFFVFNMFRSYTKHRGMWHSLPAALIASTVAFLLSSNPDIAVRLFQAWAVLLGFLSHLLLDELYSVDLNGRRLKKSFGTALKFWGTNGWANYSTYIKLAVVTLLAINDPMLQQAIETDETRLPNAAKVAIQSLQYSAICRWFPHDHLTHQDFNQKNLLPIRRGANSGVQGNGSTDGPGFLVQWWNSISGRTRDRSTDPTAEPFDNSAPTSEFLAQPNEAEKIRR